jgi:predicted amidophosphoribosyltransferase
LERFEKIFKFKRFKSIFALKDPIINIFYPNLCLNCQKQLKKNYFYFCKNCLLDFSYLPKNNFQKNIFSTFENTKSITSFLQNLKSEKILSFSKIAASFMVVQMDNLNLKMPDVIVPLNPKKLLKKTQNYYLAKNLNFFLKKRVLTKPNKTQNVLVVSDILNLKDFKNLQSSLEYKTITYLSLVTDVFFDDLDLSK